jgi:tight adherence protein B
VNDAGYAMLLLAGTGAVGIVGLWQLLAGGSRRAELAARGRAGAGEGSTRSLVRALDIRFRRTPTGERMAAWMSGAGVALRPVELIGLTVAASAVGTLILVNLFATWLALVLAVGGSVLAARTWIERRRGSRRDAFVAQLPEVARMLSNGASAGLSIPQAVRLASRELADPAGAELKRVIEEMQVGRTIEDALEALRLRLPSREVSVLMTTIIIQQRGGGDTVAALAELAGTLEARKDLRREIATLLSGVIFTSYLVAGIGGGTILVINLMSPGVTRQITSAPVGIAGLIVAGILWTIAFVAIRRTTRVDV